MAKQLNSKKALSELARMLTKGSLEDHRKIVEEKYIFNVLGYSCDQELSVQEINGALHFTKKEESGSTTLYYIYFSKENEIADMSEDD